MNKRETGQPAISSQSSAVAFKIDTWVWPLLALQNKNHNWGCWKNKQHSQSKWKAVELKTRIKRNVYKPSHTQSSCVCFHLYMQKKIGFRVSEAKICHVTIHKMLCTTPANWLTALHRIAVAIGWYLLQWEDNSTRGQDDHGQQAVAQDTRDTAMWDPRDAHQVQQGMHGKAPHGTHPIHVAKMNFSCLE